MEEPMQASTLRPEQEGERVAFLRKLVAPHVESFNFAMDEGLRELCNQLDPVYIEHGNEWARFEITDLHIGKPVHAAAHSDMLFGGAARHSREMLPRHARESGSTYRAELNATLAISTSRDGEIGTVQRRLGFVPIMVRSTKCHLAKLTPRELVALNEEEYELGGYFVSNGVEKVVRMIIVPRRNHAIALKRAANANRGAIYSQYSVSMRCSRPDLTTQTLHLHALTSGGINARVVIRRQEFLIPLGVILRALVPSDLSDAELFDMLIGPRQHDDHLMQRATAVLIDAANIRDRHFESAKTAKGKASSVQVETLAFLGKRFRVVLGDLVPGFMSNEDAGRALLRKYVMAHLSVSPREAPDAALDMAKAEILCLLARKLSALVQGEIQEDNPDSLMHQEVLLPGHLFLMYLSEKVGEYLSMLKSVAAKDLGAASTPANGDLSNRSRSGKSSRSRANNILDPKYLTGSLLQRNPLDITRRMEYFIATGNLQTSTGLDLMQAAGYSVVADRINFLRFVSHFRCVHRGQFFTDVKTTSVRRLLPEAWGFVCPVHTPDGAPCGLLNHLSHAAFAAQSPAVAPARVIKLLAGTGMLQLSTSLASPDTFVAQPPAPGSLPVLLDGRLLGHATLDTIEGLVELLRASKVNVECSILPELTEITYVPRRKRGLLAGIFMYTTPARLMRPVRWLKLERGLNAAQASPERAIEFVGTFEQMFLRICNAESAQRPELEELEEREERAKAMKSNSPHLALAEATHAEVRATNMFSVAGALTPFSDMNPSPRNIYQCQMAKQAMGTPCHQNARRVDSKSYRLLTPQVPATRNRAMQDPGGLDLFPNGFNAVVCVISYTGYDMEDAMVINKACLQRGFAAGVVYTNTTIDLDAGGAASGSGQRFGGNDGVGAIGEDGLPEVGARITQGDALYSVVDSRGVAKTTLHKSSEPAVVDQVRVLAPSTNSASAALGPRRVMIKLRFDRTPVIGDKFASRHGQKGTLAAMWPQEDMPYSESGIIPDILFNPNGFPSRMTIGMMVESMCGKSSAMHGTFQDSTPFRFDEKRAASQYFGEQLLAAGYSFYGNEVLYSGYSGEPLEVDIFMGVVHYQRLRHMTTDKWQVRSTGPVNPITRQPIKGRKVGGAIRFGEMERDALLAHGTAYLLQDRLQNCSDLHSMYVCTACGGLIGVVSELRSAENGDKSRYVRCRSCAEKSDPAQLERVLLPYVFKYLANELAAMNVSTQLLLTD